MSGINVYYIYFILHLRLEIKHGDLSLSKATVQPVFDRAMVRPSSRHYHPRPSPLLR